MPRPPEKILVRGLNWLGDAVMSTPALQRLREAHPAAHITLLTPEKLAGLWQGQSFLDEVISFVHADSLWHLGTRLRREKFTLALAFPNSFRSALELWLSRAPQRIGLARNGRSLLLTKALAPRPGAERMRRLTDAEVHARVAKATPPPPVSAVAHHVHDYLYLAQAAGASAEPLPPRIEVTASAEAQARQTFGLTETGGPWFGLNPGAEYGPAKRWPAERFAATAQALHRSTGCRWLIFGSPNDLPVADRIAMEIRRIEPAVTVHVLAGRTTLPELAALMKICRLLLTNDSGPMHLAAAVGTPLTAIFGSTSPEMTGPIFSPSARVVRHPVPCSPCFRRNCPIDLRCLTAVTVKDVAAF